MFVPALTPRDAAVVRRRRVARGVRLLVFVALGSWLFQVAWRMRFGLPQTPLADEDVWGYLYPPLCKLTGGGFVHVFSREWLYPGFLFVNLCFFNAFDVIASVQHGLGLLTGALLVAAWAEFVRMAPPAKGFTARELRGWAAGVSALILAAVYLLVRRPILTEHTLRPEAVFPFFGALHLWLTCGFVRRRWVLHRPESAVRWGAAAVFVTGVLLLLRPAFGLAAGLANVPVAIALLSRGEPWQRKVQLVGVPVALATGLLFAPEWMLARADRASTTLMSAMRVAVHADLVRAQIAEDLAQPGPFPGGYDRAWLAALKARFDTAFEHSARPENRWSAVGFNGDYLVAVEPFYAGSFADTKEGDAALAAFCNGYYRRVWQRHPLAMLAKVGREMKRFYQFNPKHLRKRALRYTVDPDTELEIVPLTAAPYYPRTVRTLEVPNLRNRMERSDAFQTQLTKCRDLAVANSGEVAQPKAVGMAERFVRATYLPVLVLALASVVRLRHSRPVQAGATLVLFGYNLGICLTVAIVQTLSTTRYIENQAVFTLSAYAAGAWLAATAGGSFFTRPKA